MRYLWIASVLFLFHLSNAEAGLLTNNELDLCKLTVGHWQGTFTIKNPNDCKLYDGCTHEISADVSPVSGNTYKLDLKPTKGKGGVLDMNCDKGNITSSQLPGGKASLTCNIHGQCMVSYIDQRITCQMSKQA